MAVDLQQRLESDLKDAMRGQERVRVEAIRMLMAELKNETIDRRRPLTIEEADRVTARVAKRHRDSIDQFEQGGRSDLVDHEKAQLAVVEQYLPELMSREDTEAAVRETMAGMDLSGGPRAQGAVMAALSSKLRGKADMRLVSEIVRTELASRAADAP